MKKILLSLGLIGLGLISFCSAGTYTYTGHITSTNSSQNVLIQLPLPIIENITHSFSVSCSFSNYIQLSNTYVLRMSNTYLSNGRLNQVNTQLSNTYSFGDTITYSSPDSKYYVYFSFVLGTPVSNLSYDYTCTINGDNIIDQFGGSSSCDYSDYELKSNITETYCTNKFSTLIDESDITSGYCETEFGLIDPENCPASGGTGDIQRSSFFVNSHQVEGASNIYLYLPDFLNWDYTYIDNGSTLEVNVENQGDEDYINSLLAIETYHPSSEDFTQSFTGTIMLLMPYIIIVLFILFIWRLIKRIFK